MKSPGALALNLVVLARSFLNAPAWKAVASILFLIIVLGGLNYSGAYFHQHADRRVHLSTGNWQHPGGQSGTSIEAHISATGFWEEYEEYDWSLEIDAPRHVVLLDGGESTLVPLNLLSTRHDPSTDEQIGVRGEICASNVGERPTIGLRIVNVIQYKTKGMKFQDLQETQVSTDAKPSLRAGESHCYEYKQTFEPIPDAKKYRIVARVTITNHSGWLPGGRNCPGPKACPFGPEPKADFGWPSYMEKLTLDESALLLDQVECPPGLICLSNSEGSWYLPAAETLPVHIEIRIVSMPEGGSQLHYRVVLQEADTGTLSTASTTIQLSAPPSLRGK